MTIKVQIFAIPQISCTFVPMDKNLFQGIDLRQIKIAHAKKVFYEFCRLTEPDFYTDRKPHLKILCNTLDDFYYGRLIKTDGSGDPFMKLMIRMGPQFGKSRTLVNFCKWVFGNNQEERIITGSYGDDPATEFSRFTRDGIMEQRGMEKDSFIFSDIFPNVRIKKTDASVQKWALEGQHFNYKGVGISGAVTSKGATLRIVDDLIKDAEEAMNEAALEKIWRWFSGTFSSRTSAKGGEIKEIFCGTLWGEGDTQMILLETEGDEWFVLSMPVYDEETDTMLCDDILNKKAFEKLKKRMCVDSRTKSIFYANYMCEAIDDNETKVFPRSSINTYKELPMENVMENGVAKVIPMGWTFAFIDTADEGDDNFSMPVFRIVTDASGTSKVYLIDAIFDQNNLTDQERPVQDMIQKHKITKVVIEANNAGAYFVRRCQALNAEKEEIKDKYGKIINVIIPYPHRAEYYGQYSRANKMSRIFNMAGIIKNFFYFPEEPDATTHKFIKQVFKLMRTSKKDDDAPDSLSGAAYHLNDVNYNLFG